MFHNSLFIKVDSSRGLFTLGFSMCKVMYPMKKSENKYFTEGKKFKKNIYRSRGNLSFITNKAKQILNK